MATYLELRQLYGNGDLLNRIEVAAIIAADAVRVEDAGTTNHANRLLWAKATFTSSRSVAEQMLKALLAANKDLTVAQLTGATDASLQTAVNNAVNIFATGS
jgi:hypothetical protein